MIKEFALILGCLILPSAVAANTGKIRFLNHTVDFGSVKRGSVLSYDFHFKNEGQGPLKILEVSGACDCTVLNHNQLLKRSFPPGEGGQVSVALNTEGHSGALLRVLTVKTEEKLTPVRSLAIMAKIFHDYLVDYERVDFSGYARSPDMIRKVRFSPVNGFELQLQKIEYNKRLFTVDVSPDGEDRVLSITPQLGGFSGNLREEILVTTNSRKQKNFRIELFGWIPGAIGWEPDYLEFGVVGKNKEARRLLRIRSGQADQSVSVKDVEVYLNGAKISQGENPLVWKQSMLNSQEFEIIVKNTFRQSGSLHGTLTLSSDKVQAAELKVDFYAFFQ